MSGVLGWDIGGVNTKAARVAGAAAGRGRVLAVRAAPYEVQRDPAALAPLLARLAAELDAGPGDAPTRRCGSGASTAAGARPTKRAATRSP